MILTPAGSSGDVNPFLALGRALRARGHEITVLAAEPFARPAASAGLEFVSTWSADAYDAVTKDPSLWHPTRGIALVLRIVSQHLQRAYALLDDVYRPGRSVLVGHTLSFSTRVFEEHRRAPAVTVHLSPTAFRSDFTQPAFPAVGDLSSWPRWAKRSLWWLTDRFALDPHVVPALNSWRRELGLPPVSRVFQSWLHSPQRVLGLFPEWFAERQPDWPAQLVMPGFVMGDDSRSPDLHAGATDEATTVEPDDEFVNGAKPIVFTPGSANRQARAFFRAAVEALERLGRPGLFVTSYRDHLPDALPPSVRHVSYAPFTTLFPKAAAVVHHGGIGTTAQGLAAGVPQLLMPYGFDQPDNARRVTRLGVGAAIPPRKFTGARVADALGRLVALPPVADACRKYAEEVRTSRAIERACEAIETVGRNRGG